MHMVLPRRAGHEVAGLWAGDIRTAVSYLRTSIAGGGLRMDINIRTITAEELPTWARVA